jgi:hypothetical protein
MERVIESVVLGLMTLIFTIRLLVNAAVYMPLVERRRSNATA